MIEEPEGLSAKEALFLLRQQNPPLEFENKLYKDGSNKFDKNIRFATLEIKHAGWLYKSAGTWSVTNEGIEAYNKYTDPKDFYEEASRLYHLKTKKTPGDVIKDQSIEESMSDDVIDDIDVTLEEVGDRAWEQVKEFLHTMDPYDVQKLVAGLFTAMGYYVDWVAPPGKDGGIDIVAYTNILGVGSPKIKVQVKREISKTDEPGMRGFIGLINDDDIGLYVAIGGFTEPAQKETRKERKRLLLIDAWKLKEMWTENYEKLDEDSRELMPMKPIWFLRGQKAQ